MPKAKGSEAPDWSAVVAKAAAFLCLELADMESATVLDKGEFLMRFGLSRADAAAILGTTDESLRVSASRRTRRGKTKRTPAKKAGIARGRRG